MSRPNALMVICVIRPMNARTRPAAVIRGQILGVGVTERLASSSSCLEAVLLTLLVSCICSIVVCRVRASNGLARQVIDVCEPFWWIPLVTRQSQARMTRGIVEKYGSDWNVESRAWLLPTSMSISSTTTSGSCDWRAGILVGELASITCIPRYCKPSVINRLNDLSASIRSTICFLPRSMSTSSYVGAKTHTTRFYVCVPYDQRIPFSHYDCFDECAVSLTIA